MATGTEQALLPLTPDEEALLRSLRQVMFALPRALDTDLVREQRITLAEYTTLMHLSEAPRNMLRMSELAAANDVSLSGMTRLVTRLEERGLVKRTKCAEDARGWNAALTDAGLTRLREAWPTHLASVRRHIFTHLEGFDLARLATALSTFAT
ncbi:MarR family winged helix-turn-helix transcriptional regulator [Sphaerisporangium aureirubrum]|uniref:MarR family winged helix-turn-helix transcriptional regulator n=1 Tax=Sphaerisporangium aureirubrum TaxID=1544736 RepID=A0ABW1NFS5_9ACTN